MMTMTQTNIESIIRTNSGIAPDYQHYPKQVRASAPFVMAGALLKWYEVYPQDHPAPDEISQMAQAFLTQAEFEARGMGFVLLHRCGEDFYFLIICTWRNSNELWETVFYKDGDSMADFALFPRDGDHKPTLCVWELVPVWHEQQTWVRFLSSPRDEKAAQAWLNDCFAGLA